MRGQKDPLGALRQSWGHCEQLEDFPGEVGTPRHCVTPQSWGHPHRVTPQSWGISVSPRWCQTPKLGTHHSVTPQSWGHPHMLHPKVGVCPRGGSAPTFTPWRHIPKLGTPLWGPILCAPPIADCTVPMGWERGAPFIFGIKVYFVITGGWGMPPLRE